MTNAPDHALHRRAVSLWLMVIAALVFATVIVGGTTRMTGSGLSIVEWRPVTGALPPLSQTAWETEFAKYKEIPQYTQQNAGMSLSEFKFIYWWEWGHRQLGRLIGIAFFVPLLFFLWRGWIGPGLRGRLWLIFGLGAVQGGVGWWMVASGLSERISVAHERLAFHLTLALVIFAAIVWTLQRLIGSPQPLVPDRIRRTAVLLLIFVFVQIFFGALVAGLRGGLIYNTWPLMDGEFIPAWSKLALLTPGWINLFDNILTVQFIHRMLAYALWAGAVLHVIDVARTLRGGPALSGALLLAMAVTLQAGIGIVTLLHHTPLSLGLLHQGMAVVVLTAAVWHAARLTPNRAVRAGTPNAALELRGAS